MTTVLAESINYHSAHVLHSTYQYTKVLPVEGLGSYTVTNGAGPVMTFVIAPKVVNLAESSLIYTISLPTQGAAAASWMNINGMKHFSQVTVQAANSDYLMLIPDIDAYLDITARRSHAFNNVQTWDQATSYAAAAALGNQTFYEGLIPSNYVNANDARLDGTPSVKTGQESIYALGSGLNMAFYLDVKFKLDKFVDTVLAMNHNSYYAGNNLTITITFAPLSRYCWSGTSNANPNTGAVASAVNATINFPYLLLAVEKNEAIVRDIVARCNSQAGMTYRIPFVRFSKQAIPQGVNSVTAQWTSSMGKYLQKVWLGVYATNPATPNLIFDKSNLADAKLTLIQSKVDDIPIQQQAVDPGIGEDFLFRRDELRGSDILSFNEHLYNYAWCDNFTEKHDQFLKTLFPDIPSENLIDGIPMSRDQFKYSVDFTSAAALTYYIFSVWLREVTITGSLITIT